MDYPPSGASTYSAYQSLLKIVPDIPILPKDKALDLAEHLLTGPQTMNELLHNIGHRR